MSNDTLDSQASVHCPVAKCFYFRIYPYVLLGGGVAVFKYTFQYTLKT